MKAVRGCSPPTNSLSHLPLIVLFIALHPQFSFRVEHKSPTPKVYSCKLFQLNEFPILGLSQWPSCDRNAGCSMGWHGMVDPSSPSWIGISLPTEMVLEGYLVFEDFLPVKEYFESNYQELLDVLSLYRTVRGYFHILGSKLNFLAGPFWTFLASG